MIIDDFKTNITNIKKSIYTSGINADKTQYNDFFYKYGIPLFAYNLEINLFGIEELKNFINFFLTTNEKFYSLFFHTTLYVYSSVLTLNYRTKNIVSVSIELRECTEVENNDIKIYKILDDDIVGFIKTEKNIDGFILTAYCDSMFHYIYYNHTKYQYTKYQYFYLIDNMYIHIEESFFSPMPYSELFESKTNFFYVKNKPKAIELMDSNILYTYFYYSEIPLLINTNETTNIKNVIYHSLNDEKIHEYYIHNAITNPEHEKTLFENFLLSGNDLFLSSGNIVNFLPSNFSFHVILNAPIQTSYVPSISTNSQKYYYTCGIYNFEGGEGRIFSIFYGYGEKFNNPYNYNYNMNFVITEINSEEKQIINKVKTDYTYIPGLGIISTPDFQYPVPYQFCVLYDITSTFTYVSYYDSVNYDNSIAPLLLCLFNIKINNTAFIFFPCYNSERSDYFLYIERYNIINNELVFSTCEEIILTENFPFDHFFFKTNYFDISLLFNINYLETINYGFNEIESWDFTIGHFDANLKNYRIFITTY